MPGWQNSDRRDRLPSNWDKIRKDDAGYRCEATSADDERCKERAVDVDHKRRGDDHSQENLRALCEWHHDKKSGAEGAAALAATRRRISKRFRRAEVHPGLM
ncbi:HNH endonuclease [Micromonospora sp. NPDC049559]|uniref:HNH endonuclease n=1 Tax=Micromonospora sp. NPDC049559 TaxID=3155923 RepID=UPI0034380465